MNEFEIPYQPGLEARGRTLSEEIDKLERELEGLAYWQVAKKRQISKALKRAHEEHGDTIDWIASFTRSVEELLQSDAASRQRAVK